jgi:hypothetical protein
MFNLGAEKRERGRILKNWANRPSGALALPPGATINFAALEKASVKVDPRQMPKGSGLITTLSDF